MSKWIPSWQYVPIDYNRDVASFENITQESVFTNNLAGEKVKLRFNNLYSEHTMSIDAAAIAVRNRVSGKLSPEVAVRLSGNEKICLLPNTAVYSDEIELPVTAQDDFIVKLYFKEKTEIRCVCITWAAYTWQSVHHTGNFTQTQELGFTVKPQLAPGLAADPYPNQFAAGISEICVLTEDNVKLIALFGDSITHMSYFSDPLTAALYAKFPGACAVVNAGICGNRLQKTFPSMKQMPGEGHQFGIAGKDRFLADLYAQATPDFVFIMEGVNDCSHSIVFKENKIPEAQDIFAALQEIAATAQKRGSRVCVTTITPFGAFGAPWRDQAEAIRCTYNDLIRTGAAGNDWIDLDAILRDPEDAHKMQAGMHLGDGVHPNWAGGVKMAKAVFDKWFKEESLL